MLIAAALVLAYALGSVNTGYYLVRGRTGLDLRSEGSGTAGATNTGRLLGRQGFVVALVGDLLKGVLAVAVARAVGATDAVTAAAAVGVVAGHIYPVQLSFRGGKGLATAFGAGVTLSPMAGLVAAVVALTVLATSRRRVLSALSGVVAAPVYALATRGADPVSVGLLLVAGLVLSRHAVPRAQATSRSPRADRASSGAG